MAMVTLMQLGFAMLEGGTVREHNTLATYAKNMLDLAIGAVAAYSWGYMMATDDAPFSAGFAGDRSLFVFCAFQSTAATIVSGAMAERTRISAYLLLSLLISGALYPLAVRFAWQPAGWLASLDPPFHDFAGSGVVHLLGGSAALAGALAVGSRRNRWDPASKGDFAPHNVPSVLGGSLLLWTCWLFFNAGSTPSISHPGGAASAARVTAATVIAGACGALVAGVAAPLWLRPRPAWGWAGEVRWWLGGSLVDALLGGYAQPYTLDILSFANGMLGGLVSITAGCDSIPLPYAAIVGALGGLVYVAAHSLRVRRRADDVVDAFAVHGACGLWGCVAVGLFARDGGLLMPHGDGQLLGSQVIGALVLGSLGGGGLLALALPLRWLGILRASESSEEKGLDQDLGLHAYTRHSGTLQRCRVVAALLAEQDYQPHQLLAALQALRGIIYRPFTPQAADHKLEGEVKDILENLDYEAFAKGGASSAHLAFCSHHKEHSGDAARVFVDTARRLLQTDRFLSSERSGLNPGGESPPQGPGHESSKRGGGAAGGVTATAPALTLAVANAQHELEITIAEPSPSLRSASKSHFGVREPASGKVSGELSRERSSPRDTLRALLSRAAGRIKATRTKDLVWLDSANLKDLPSLLSVVEHSANHVILLSRHVFERPWILAELVAAHTNGKSISLVLVEWPGHREASTRAFRFPQDLDKAIAEWQWFVANEPAMGFDESAPADGSDGSASQRANRRAAGFGGLRRRLSSRISLPRASRRSQTTTLAVAQSSASRSRSRKCSAPMHSMAGHAMQEHVVRQQPRYGPGHRPTGIAALVSSHPRADGGWSQ